MMNKAVFTKNFRKRYPFLSPFNAVLQLNLEKIISLRTLKLHKNPETLLSTLDHSFRAHGFNPTPAAYNFVLNKLFKASRFDAVPPFLDRLESDHKLCPTETFFARAIRLYGRAGRFEDAIALFFRIPRFGCDPTCCSLNSLLDVLCRTQEGLRFVPDVLLNSRLMGIWLEESSYHILIRTLCRIGSVGYAVQIFYGMINDGYGVDETALSWILTALCGSTNDMGVDGTKVLSFLEGLSQWGFSPSAAHYSKVLCVLAREGSGMMALKVLEKIKGCQVKPDIVCYTMVLDGLVWEGNYEMADKIFDELLVFGLVPTVRTYNAYINGLCEQNNVEQALDMIYSMEELGCKPNAITYGLIVKALCMSGKIGRARKIVMVMELEKVEENFRTYRIFLDTLFSLGKIVEACMLMEEMLEKGFCWHCSTYDDVIFGLCQRGMVSKAVGMLEKLTAENVGPGARAWESLLLSFKSQPTLPNALWTSLIEYNVPKISEVEEK